MSDLVLLARAQMRRTIHSFRVLAACRASMTDG